MEMGQSIHQTGKEGNEVIKSLLQNLKFYVRENSACCAVCAASLLCGVIVGTVYAFSLTELGAKELSLYFGDFFGSFVQAGTDSSVIFADALRAQAILFVFLLLCSGMIFGAPFIAAAGIGNGFSVGFTIAFLLKTYGIRALLFAAGGMLPHMLIMLPCHLAALCVCMHFSVSLLKERAGLKKQLPRHVLTLFALFAAALAAVLLQAYIEPLLVSLMAGYFVG